MVARDRGQQMELHDGLAFTGVAILSCFAALVLYAVGVPCLLISSLFISSMRQYSANSRASIGIWIGRPCPSLGCLDDPTHPEVQGAIETSCGVSKCRK